MYITVQNLTPKELIAKAIKEANLTYIDPDYENWNFEVKPAMYEVLTWKPGFCVTSNEVRDHFKELGAEGNTAAFITWMVQEKPQGFHASIPHDEGCWRDSYVSLYAPCSYFDYRYRRLYPFWPHDVWGSDQSFVGFRKVPSNTKTPSPQHTTLTLPLLVKATKAFLEVLEKGE